MANMELLFLGSDSAFTLGDGNFQSNMLFTSSTGRNLLIDCGSDIRFALDAQKLSYRDIHEVYISHLHGDHVGGMEYLDFSTQFGPGCEAPTLHISRELAGRPG